MDLVGQNLRLGDVVVLPLQSQFQQIHQGYHCEMQGLYLVVMLNLQLDDLIVVQRVFLVST